MAPLLTLLAHDVGWLQTAGTRSVRSGVDIAASPTEIRIVFNENLEQSLSGGDVLNKAGKKIETGKAVTDPADKKQLVIPIVGQLANDTYTVDWHAVAADSHRIKGKYTFTVKN